MTTMLVYLVNYMFFSKDVENTLSKRSHVRKLANPLSPVDNCQFLDRLQLNTVTAIQCFLFQGECCSGAECQFGICTKGVAPGDPGTFCDKAEDCKGIVYVQVICMKDKIIVCSHY